MPSINGVNLSSNSLNVVKDVALSPVRSAGTSGVALPAVSSTGNSDRSVRTNTPPDTVREAKLPGESVKVRLEPATIEAMKTHNIFYYPKDRVSSNTADDNKQYVHCFMEGGELKARTFEPKDGYYINVRHQRVFFDAKSEQFTKMQDELNKIAGDIAKDVSKEIRGVAVKAVVAIAAGGGAIGGLAAAGAIVGGAAASAASGALAPVVILSVGGVGYVIGEPLLRAYASENMRHHFEANGVVFRHVRWAGQSMSWLVHKLGSEDKTYHMADLVVLKTLRNVMGFGKTDLAIPASLPVSGDAQNGYTLWLSGTAPASTDVTDGAAPVAELSTASMKVPHLKAKDFTTIFSDRTVAQEIARDFPNANEVRDQKYIAQAARKLVLGKSKAPKHALSAEQMERLELKQNSIKGHLDRARAAGSSVSPRLSTVSTASETGGTPHPPATPPQPIRHSV